MDVPVLVSYATPQEQAVLCRRLDGVPDTTIAQQLGIAPGTVGSLVSRGMQRIRLAAG
jgi:DNA-directed RNA polymerase specialized sigma24 family protein